MEDDIASLADKASGIDPCQRRTLLVCVVRQPDGYEGSISKPLEPADLVAPQHGIWSAGLLHPALEDVQPGMR